MTEGGDELEKTIVNSCNSEIFILHGRSSAKSLGFVLAVRIFSIECLVHLLALPVYTSLPIIYTHFTT